jgi:hypothetical protein
MIVHSQRISGGTDSEADGTHKASTVDVFRFDMSLHMMTVSRVEIAMLTLPHTVPISPHVLQDHLIKP